MSVASKIHALAERIHKGGKYGKENNGFKPLQLQSRVGQLIKVWCAEHGVAVSSFYKWQRKTRDALLTAQNSEVQFQELERPSSTFLAASFSFMDRNSSTTDFAFSLAAFLLS